MISGKVLALDLGSRRLKLVEGRYRNKQLLVENCLVADSPEGSLRGGAVIDHLALAESLKQAVQKGKFSTDKAILTIQNPLIISRDFELPLVDRQELSSMLALEMEQYVPNLATDYVMGFTLLANGGQNGGGNKYRVVAMPKNVLHAYTEVVRNAGLKPLVVDVHANALHKLVQLNQITDNREATAFIDLGYEQTQIDIFINGNPAFSRLISFGGRQLLAEIASNQAVSLLNAEQILKSNGSLGQDANSGNDKLAEQLSANMANWIAEIQTSVRFFVGRNEELNPKTYYLYGGFSYNSELVAQIQQSLNTSVRLLEGLAAVSWQKKAQDQLSDLPILANCLGAMIRKE